MTIKISNAVAGSMLSAMAVLANNGSIKIYTGPMPATVETSTSGTLLATLTLSATAFNTPTSVPGTDAVATANAITSGNAVATGTAGYFRLLKQDGTAIWQGDVNTSGAALNLGTTSIVSGGSIAITTLTLTQPLT